MLKLRIISIVVVTLMVFSCKKEINVENTNDASKTTELVKDDLFRVSFNLNVSKDDNMHLYYTLDGSINFTEENSVWMPVKGSEKDQDVIFALPEGIIPSLLRIDFGYGKNESQSPVKLNSFKLSYQDKNEVISGQDIFKYFTPFEGYTDVDPGSTLLKRHKKDQASGPILYPQTLLSEKINKVTSGASPE